MMEVLIVSRTRMDSTHCVGGIVFPTFQSVRLLEQDGSYQPANTKFEVGQFWEIEFEPAPKIVPPHVEDVYIFSKKRLGKNFNDYNQLVNQADLKKQVWQGPAKILFEGKLGWTQNRNGYISGKSIPSISTGFWIPDKDLMFSEKHYHYRSDGLIKQTFSLSYVGVQKPIEAIPAGTIVRVSLAKWWKPKNVDMELRCYLQLSGWYD